jgi:hypothetical protein
MAKWAVLDRQLSPRHWPSNHKHLTSEPAHHKSQNITSNSYISINQQSIRPRYFANSTMAEEIFDGIQRCIDNKCLYVDGAEFFKLLQDPVLIKVKKLLSCYYKLYLIADALYQSISVLKPIRSRSNVSISCNKIAQLGVGHVDSCLSKNKQHHHYLDGHQPTYCRLRPINHPFCHHEFLPICQD